MMATINNIANMNAAAPPLIQGDFDVPYCNEETRLDRCMEWGTCHCVHLIELNLCEVYELLLFDASSEYIHSDLANFFGVFDQKVYRTVTNFRG